MLRWLWLSLGILAADQATKGWALSALRPYEVQPVADGWLNLTLAFNPGAAFSFLSDAGGWQRWFFSGLAAVVCVILGVWLARLERHERATAAGLAMVIGGATGNLIDRLRLGHVVDFIDFYHPALAGWPGFSAAGHWPAFNLADSAITAGVALLIAGSLRRPT
jgi:signal peptidase II